MTTITTDHFDRQYQSHLKHLKLKGLQPKTINAYARAIRRIGARFEHRIDCLTEGRIVTKRCGSSADFAPPSIFTVGLT